jgi:dihydropteroate synthase
VSAELEAARVFPVIEGLRAAGLEQPISIDTSKAVVARAALDAGATMVNDVTALRGDPELAHVVAEAGCPVCLMHMQGQPRTMQVSPYYDDVVGEVGSFLADRFSAALLAGIRSEAVLLDPGIGFGKALEHNLLLLRNLDRLAALGRPIVLGTSRKRFLGELLGVESAERVLGTAVTTALGLAGGALIFRVHDVPPNVQALTVARAVLRAGEEA